MIVAQQKPLAEIKEMLAGYQKILILGCGTCTTVCFAGGEKEVGVLASALRMAARIEGEGKDVEELTIQRQCEWEFIDPIAESLRAVEAVLSLGCGVGVQALAERVPEARVLPGLNTAFMGLPLAQGVWSERCAGCGDCVLALTGGICPIARCSKSLLNGPCGGAQDGKCEVDPSIDCAWQVIYDRLKAVGRLDLMAEIIPHKDWSSGRDGGPRRIVREDLQIEEPKTI